MMKDWSKLFRSQTASATTILTMIGFLIGGGNLFSSFGILLLIYSIFLHWFIFGNNSLMDSCMVSKFGELPYDVKDLRKSHHPLVTGNISLSIAHKIIYVGIMILALLGIIFSFFSEKNSFFSLSFFLLFVVTGFSYNCGLSKVTIWKFLPICFCFCSLLGFSYFLVASVMTHLFILILLYIFLTIMFQTSIEGDQKDIESNEANMLRFLGSRVNTGVIEMSNCSKIYGWAIKICGFFVSLFILIEVGLYWSNLLMFIPFSFLSIYFAFKIINENEWGREKKILYYSLEEISSIFLLAVIFIPVIGFLQILTLMFFGIMYFIIMNILNWNTFLTPKV